MEKDLIKEISRQIVHTESLFSVDETFDDPRFMRVRVAALHSGINRNNSKFTTEVVKKAKNSFANIPILADVQVHVDSDGNEYLDYSGHSMHIEEDAFNSGNDRIVYDEKVVGIVPESNNFEIVYDEETGNDYFLVDALIFREYGNYCCDILESRGGKTDVSAEISVGQCSYSASEKCLEVGEMQMCGITLLGEDVTPGMAKAHAEVFSLNTDNRDAQLIEIMQELKKSLDNYTAVYSAKDTKKGGQIVFEELLEKYGKTVEEITFEYEGLSDEELKAAFEEAFAESQEGAKTFDDDDAADGESDVDADPTDSSEESEESTEDTTEGSEDSDEGIDTQDDDEEEEEDVDDDKKVKYEISFGETKKEFAVSLSDVIYALSELVNETYADEGSYYGVDVYAEDGYVIMHDYYTGRAYRQAYKCKKDKYSLFGDRVEVKAVYVTEDEAKKLDDMRCNYSAISEKLAKYEEEPQKMEILESEEYSVVCEKEEFVELKQIEKHFDLTIDEVRAKADEITLSYAKKGALNFSSVETGKKTATSKSLPSTSKKASRYGTMFSRQN